ARLLLLRLAQHADPDPGRAEVGRHPDLGDAHEPDPGVLEVVLDDLHDLLAYLPCHLRCSISHIAKRVGRVCPGRLGCFGRPPGVAPRGEFWKRAWIGGPSVLGNAAAPSCPPGVAKRVGRVYPGRLGCFHRLPRVAPRGEFWKRAWIGGPSLLGNAAAPSCPPGAAERVGRVYPGRLGCFHRLPRVAPRGEFWKRAWIGGPSLLGNAAAPSCPPGVAKRVGRVYPGRLGCFHRLPRVAPRGEFWKRAWIGGPSLLGNAAAPSCPP